MYTAVFGGNVAFVSRVFDVTRDWETTGSPAIN